MSNLSITLDTGDKHTLRVTASFLLALAGDIKTEITGADHPVITGETFTAAELSESEKLAKVPAVPVAVAEPDPAKVFGGNGAGEPAPSIAAVVPSETAPAAATVTSVPTVPSVPVPSTENAAPAPSVPAAPSTPAPSVELDVRGLPWDPRIHSRTKSKLANGQWKNARGIDAALVTQVETELANLMKIPAAPVQVPEPPLAPAVVVAPPPASPAVPVPPVSTVANASPSNVTTFPDLMQKVAGAIAAKQLNQAQVLAVTQKHGVQALPLLIQRPDLIPQVVTDLDAQIAANVASGQPV
jgi:hypothetical protein